MAYLQHLFLKLETREPGVSKYLKTQMEAEAEQGQFIGVTWCAVNLLDLLPHAPVSALQCIRAEYWLLQ